MLAARLHGPADLRVERVPHPGSPKKGQALLRVKSTGICGSDLHSYKDARIGDTVIKSPLILGHEFSGIIEDTGPEAMDGQFKPLQLGARVAVDPAQPCGRCDLCERGSPNLCRHLHFCGNYPDGGSLCQWMHMPARACFPVPAKLTYVEAALLEPLGVALHAVDLCKIRVGETAAIFGAGSIGLLILQLLKIAGADSVFVADPLAWRLTLASQWGGIPITCFGDESVGKILDETRQCGVDVAIEAAWGGASIAQATEVSRLGGRVVLVGIPGDDVLTMKHSTARRKGLTILMSRRMKHAYPRAIRLAQTGKINLSDLVTHTFPLRRAAAAFALNAAYQENVVKVMISN